MSEIIFNKGLDPDALTAYIREVPVPSNHALGQFFPDVTTEDEEIELQAEVTKRRQISGFRAVDGDFQSLDRDGWTTWKTSMMFLGNRMNLSEFERLKLEAAKKVGGGNSTLVDRLYDDVTTQVNAVREKQERLYGDILTTGKLDIDENNVKFELDFKVPATHFVNSAVEWSDPNAKIIEQITGWMETYVADAGHAAGGMIINKKILGQLLRNKEILDANLYGHPQGNVPRVRRSVLDEILAEFDLPPITLVYDTQGPDMDADTSSRIIPENKVIFVPPAEQRLGRMVWGQTATALELMGAAQTDSSFAASPGLVGIIAKSGPPFKQESFLDARGLPVVDNPKGLFVATVNQ